MNKVDIPYPMSLIGTLGCAECGRVVFTRWGYRRHWVRHHAAVQWRR